MNKQLEKDWQCMYTRMIKRKYLCVYIYVCNCLITQYVEVCFFDSLYRIIARQYRKCIVFMCMHDWHFLTIRTNSFFATIECWKVPNRDQETVTSACRVISSGCYVCSICWTGTVRVAGGTSFHSCLKLSNFSIIVITTIRACHENAYYLPHLSRRKYFNDRILATISAICL